MIFFLGKSCDIQIFVRFIYRTDTNSSTCAAFNSVLYRRHVKYFHGNVDAKVVEQRSTFNRLGRRGRRVLPKQHPATQREELCSDLYKSYLFRLEYIWRTLRQISLVPKWPNPKEVGDHPAMSHVLRSSGNRVTWHSTQWVHKGRQILSETTTVIKIILL